MNYKMIFFFGVLVFNLLFGLNYSEDISPIIYNNCTSCHRSGEIGAFLPLTNYFDVYENEVVGSVNSLYTTPSSANIFVLEYAPVGSIKS